MTITRALIRELARWNAHNRVALHTDPVIWCATEPCDRPALRGHYCRRHLGTQRHRIEDE